MIEGTGVTLESHANAEAEGRGWGSSRSRHLNTLGSRGIQTVGLRRLNVSHCFAIGDDVYMQCSEYEIFF